jgi:hypothetical protein
MVQGPLKCEWQYRLVDKGDWFVGANRRSRRLIEICAEKDATNSAKRVYVVGCFNPTAALGKPDVHKSHIGAALDRTGNSFWCSGRNGAHFMTQTHHDHFQVHCDESFVLDDHDSHSQWLSWHRDRQLNRITVVKAICCDPCAKLGCKSPHDPRAHSHVRVIIRRSLSGIGNAQH